MQKNQISLAQIRAFCALAQHRSFKEAAKWLGTPQSSLVSHISKLEENYNAKLFYRQRENNRLTNIGMALLPSFKTALYRVKEAEYLLMAHSEVQTGEIHLAAVSPYKISKLIKKFNTLYPNIHIKVTFTSTEQAQKLVSTGIVDAGFYVQEQKVPGQQSYFFYQYELIAIIPIGHPLTEKEELSLKDFNNQNFLSREEGSLTRDTFFSAIEQHDVSVNTVYELGSREAIREAVANGLGVSVVAEDEHVSHEGIVVKRIRPERLAINSHMIILNDRVNSPLGSALINMLENAEYDQSKNRHNSEIVPESSVLMQSF